MSRISFHVLIVLLTLLGCACCTKAHAGMTIESSNTNSDYSSPNHVYVLCIGVNTYKVDNFWGPNVSLHDLHGAVLDATSFDSALMTVTHKLDVTDTVLLEGAATRTAIISELSKIAKVARPQDVFIFYFSGIANEGVRPYAVPTSSQYFLYPSGIQHDYPDEGITIPLLRTLASQIAARNQLFIFDTSTTRQTFRAFYDDIFDKDAASQQLLGRNIVLIAPAGDEYESRNESHGYVTLALIAGLNGQANFRHAWPLTARELEAFVPYKTMQMTNLVQAACVDQGNDFALGAVTASMQPEPYIDDDYTGQADGTAPAPMRAYPLATPPSVETPPTNQPGKNYAVFFATDQYDSTELPTLSNPVSDANKLAAALQTEYGFDTDVEVGLNSEDILNKIAAYREKLQPNDQFFVYFAGHGIYFQEDGVGFIAAKDSVPDNLSQAGIQYGILRNMLNLFPCKHILLALDVCFGGSCDPALEDESSSLPDAKPNGPFHWQARIIPAAPAGLFRLTSDDSPSATDQSVSDQDYLQRIQGRKCRMLLASVRLNTASDGDPGENSPFATALLNEFETHAQEHKMLTWLELVPDLKRLPQEPHAATWDTDPDADFVFEPK